MHARLMACRPGSKRGSARNGRMPGRAIQRHRLLDFIGARDGSLGRRAFVSNGGTAYYERKQDCHRASARRESCFLKGVLLSVVVTRNDRCLNQAAVAQPMHANLMA